MDRWNNNNFIFSIMIITFVLGVFAIIIYFFTTVMSTITWVLPEQMTESMTWFFAQFSYLQGIFPISTLFEVISSVLTVWGFMYSLKIFFRFIFPIIPIIGRETTTSVHGKTRTSETIIRNRPK